MVNFKEFNSLTNLYFSQAEKLGDKPHLWRKVNNKYKDLTWNNTKKQIKDLSSSLINHGLLQGDRIFICCENRPEFFISDLGIMAAGGITVPAYTTNTSADHEYIIKHSGARAAIVSNIEIAKKVLPAVASSKCEFIIIMDKKNESFDEPVTIYSWEKFLEDGKANPQDNTKICNNQKRSDTACIIYTSGTGGRPKGVMLSHGAILHNCLGADDLLKEIFNDLIEIKFLSWLPLSHSYEHTVQFLFTGWGAQTYYAEGADKLLINMGEAKPHIMCAVPRFYDALHAKISSGLKSQSFIKKMLFNETIRLGKKVYFNKSMSKIETFKNSILDKLVRKKVKERFGGNIRCLVSGGAALNYEVGLYLSALGLPLLQGYGQTETAPVVSSNPMSKIKIDTVGMGDVLLPGATSYTAFEIDITDLLPSSTPDSIVVAFYSADPRDSVMRPSFMNQGLIIDSLTLNYPPNTVKENALFDVALIYPNPAKEIVNIALPNNELYCIDIFNLLGKKVISAYGSGKTSVNINSLGEGTYCMKIKAQKSNKVFSKVFIK